MGIGKVIALAAAVLGLAGAGLAGAAVPAAAQAVSGYGRLYVFGDSLVDSGNAQLFQLANGLPDPAPSSAGYFAGRFSNGLNFADYLSRDYLGLGGAATPFLADGTNFAVGGAQVVGARPNDFGAQLVVFGGALTAPPTRTFEADALVLVTLGGNDVRARLDGASPANAPLTVAATLRAGLERLLLSGARNIVVMGVPDIGELPERTGNGAVFPNDAATAATVALNTAFRAVTNDFRGRGVQFYDLYAGQERIYANPAAFGLPANLNTRQACPEFGTPGAVCEGYVYFDAIHPTTQVHAAIARDIAQQLSAVPEPATWAVTVVGFAAAGAAVRRRRTAAPDRLAA